MDQMTIHRALTNYFSRFGVRDSAWSEEMARRVEILSRAQAHRPDSPIAQAERVLARWFAETLGLTHDTPRAVVAMGRAAFALSGAAEQSPYILLSLDLPPEWRGRLAAAVPAPTPPTSWVPMPEQTIEPVIPTFARRWLFPDEEVSQPESAAES